MGYPVYQWHISYLLFCEWLPEQYGGAQWLSTVLQYVGYESRPGGRRLWVTIYWLYSQFSPFLSSHGGRCSFCFVWFWHLFNFGFVVSFNFHWLLTYTEWYALILLILVEKLTAHYTNLPCCKQQLITSAGRAKFEVNQKMQHNDQGHWFRSLEVMRFLFLWWGEK